MDEKALEIVRNYVNEHLDKSDPAPVFDLYIVWKAKVLQNRLSMAELAASQNAQTGRILADNAAQTQALEQYLNPVPIPAYMVQNPNCCSQACGCGCGM